MTRRCTGVILAGGQATRYGGRPKGLERVGGKRVLDRVVEALAPATDELLLIANEARASEWLPGVRVERDLRPGCGSLGGIHAALAHAGTDIIVVAWDMPFVPARLIAALRAFGELADVVVPESDSRRGVEPLCAYYSGRCLAPIERQLDAGERHVVSFFDEVKVARLAAPEVATFGDPAFMFMNINSPGDLALAEQHASSTDGGHSRPKASR
ncbi:MAG TPA: molybdenum cofactor guanylyltransferase [Gemmatimonadaceae bacterium]|nr:molybdenum cofactor guanylyltransferase [Gemmatimonadaceae bacterium]